MSLTAADTPVAGFGSDQELSSHTPTAPSTSGWTGWEYTVGGVKRYFVWNDYGGILATAGGAAGIVARTNVDFADDGYHVWFDAYRLGVDSAGDTVGIVVNCINTAIGSWSNREYIIVRCVRASTSTVNLNVIHVDSSGTENSLGSTNGISWNISSGLRFGVRLSGTAITTYTAVYTTGASETAQTSATLPGGLQDGAHKRMGAFLSRTSSSAGFQIVTWSATIPDSVAVAGSGSVSWAGSGTATIEVSAAGTGSVSWAGSGTATVPQSVTGSGAVVWGGSGTANVAVRAAGSGSVTWSGSGTQRTVHTGNAIGSVLWGGGGSATVSGVGRAADRRTVLDLGSQIFTTSLPPLRWAPREASIGGRIVATSGVPAAYLVRRDRLIDVTLRIQETEWLDFLNVFQALQVGLPFTWFPTADRGVGYLVTLFAPMVGQRLTPTRLAGYPRVFTVPLTFRGVGAVVPWRVFYED